ncbi:energy transducer TonB [Flavobacterium sp. MAH-1]|uniref:Energy transducer TonB n=1 Tax=Flavobacterium agri TaxID=2743471 RepID=A0A7Y8Y561_9FLAO|nr:energy transducer TonB [Flavobacterium agri]NUY82557.1 energy transducer TonB [Flavobacterium agri]NYA72580.1 energy transducer TonB [Flavobacterium agri]
MKKLFFVSLAFVAHSVCAQEISRTYLDSTFRKTEEGKHSYYRTISKQDDQYLSQTFYKSGKLQLSVKCSTPEGGFYEGVHSEYWENGNKKKTSNYEKGRETGETKSWYENGKPHMTGHWRIWGKTNENRKFVISDFWKESGEQTVTNGKGYYSEEGDVLFEEGPMENEVRVGKWSGRNSRHGLSFEETYDYNGELISGKSIDASGIEYSYTEVDKKPQYKSGMNDFYTFVRTNFRTPKDAKPGRIIIGFLITSEGFVKDVKVLRSLGASTDQEVMNMFEKIERWTPAFHRGKPIDFPFTMPIMIAG